MNRVYNFNAGPAVLPLEVLEKAQRELLDFAGTGMSVMEISHRSKEFTKINDEAQDRLRAIMGISADYEVLFLQGGASLQFAMIPMNLAVKELPVDIIVTGAWSKKALKEIKKVSIANIVASSEDKNFSYIPKDNLKFSGDASYVHVTSNNTIFGTQFKSFPSTGSVPLVADMSSDILCCPVDVNRFGAIYAGAQKNIGPSGLVVVILRKDLMERAPESLPTMLQYRTHAPEKSLYNTPPTFGIYMVNLVFEWVQKQGGLESMAKNNQKKAQMIYDAIDSSSVYTSPVAKEDRSNMNVVFRVNNDEALEKNFVERATQKGLIGLKGHRSVGGIRASIYNAHPMEGAQALVSFMKEFESQI